MKHSHKILLVLLIAVLIQLPMTLLLQSIPTLTPPIATVMTQGQSTASAYAHQLEPAAFVSYPAVSDPWKFIPDTEVVRESHPSIGGDAWILNGTSCAGMKHITRENTPQRNMPIIVHYHIQHMAGTALYNRAHRNHECATRICRQSLKQCMVSYNETVEAQAIKATGFTFLPYEALLRPMFSLPFVDKELRRDFIFTTIMRNPFHRFLSVAKRKMKNPKVNLNYWWDITHGAPHKHYHADNLPVRWLAGIATDRSITQEDMDRAKCRLELFDLVMTEETLEPAVSGILASTRNWTKGFSHKPSRPNYTNPLGPDLDRIFLGGWLERHRPSFELYDYARRLAVRHLREAGLEPPAAALSRVPSFITTMQAYALPPKSAFPESVLEFSSQNYEANHHGNNEELPVDCSRFHLIWKSGPDRVPRVPGLGTLSFE